MTDRVQNPILTEANFQRQLPELEQYARKKLEELHERKHLEDFMKSVSINHEFMADLFKEIKGQQGREARY